MAKNVNAFERLRRAKETRLGYGIASMIEGALAFAAATWAIGSGSMWAYLFATVFTVGSLTNLYRAFTYQHGTK